MQTIEEYKAYAKQLEAEVGKWHKAYDALMAERTQLVHKVLNLEETNAKLEKKLSTIMDGMTQPRDAEIDTLASGSRNLNEAIEAMAAELEELRKHEVQWDLDKARIKELETERNIAAQQCSEMCLKIAALETELEQNKN